jgi:hypothetical protein
MPTFNPLNTKDETTSFRKTLLYSTHGWGKTTQAKHYKAKYGKGFIISGESGLSSVRSEGIDYLPFSSFDGTVDAANGIYSFVEICRLISSNEFKQAGYKWLMLDSLTELADLCMEWATAKVIADAAATGKKVNGFDKWETYREKMIGACKFIRDMPYHVCITALAKDSEDEDGNALHLPLVLGNAVQAQLPGIFDNVLCGTTRKIKATETTPARTERIIVSAQLNGWQGKVRDEHRVVQPVEVTGDVTDILDKIDTAEKKAALAPIAANIAKVAGNGNAAG